MAIYLGSAGFIELTRYAASAFESEMNTSDVDVGERQFSFDFPNGTFITGDQIQIKRLNPDGTPSTQPLDFVSPAGWGDNTQYPDGSWYAHVDPLGGIRLYSRWADALSGSRISAVELHAPALAYKIQATVSNSTPHCIGQIASYSVSTERDALDITSLGDAFAQRVSGLISGSGSIECFWDWVPAVCSNSNVEMAQYLHQLILRQQLGSEFKASLIIKRDGAEPMDAKINDVSVRTSLMYDVTAIVTDVGIDFDPAEALRSKISFVTTGEISLRYQVPSAALILQEDRSKITLEDIDGYLAQEMQL
jgi:hypothetical protein